MEVAEALATMGQLVDKGHFAEVCITGMWRSGDVHCDQVRSCTCCVQAAKVGRQAAIPLALPKGDLSPLDDQLSSGGQSTVYRAAWRGQQVAVKKAKITTAQDLSNLKLELLMMAEMHHSGVLPLLAAHVLPPGALLWGCCPMQLAGLCCFSTVWSAQLQAVLLR